MTTFVDDMAILKSHYDTIKTFSMLQKNLNSMRIITVIQSKSAHVTFTVRRKTFTLVYHRQNMHLH